MESEPTTIGITEFLGLLRRRWVLIAACLIAAAAIAYGYTKHKTRVYTASAAIAFNPNPIDQEIAGLPSSSSGTPLLTQEAIDREQVSVSEAPANTARLVGGGLTPLQVSSSVTVSAHGETNLVDVEAKASSPLLAARIANVYAGQFVSEQQHADRKYYAAALTVVKRQLAELSPVQRFGSDGLDLENRAHTLRLLADLGSENVKVAQQALTPTSPTSPQVSKDTLLGALIGLAVGAGLALLLERLDRRLRTPDELEDIYELPLLGVVPTPSRGDRGTRRPRAPSEPLGATQREAFGLLHAQLRLMTVDSPIRTLVVASPLPGDGKTTTALHLAAAAARSGSRVLLIEADLRKPMLAEALRLPPTPGLAGVLSGSAWMEEAIVSSGADRDLGRDALGDTFDVLPAGPTVPFGASGLFEGAAIDAVIGSARLRYDLTVIDTAPLAEVADAFPLLAKVDGVALVGRVGFSNRDAATRLHHVLSGSGARLAGVIVLGAPAPRRAPYASSDPGPRDKASVNGMKPMPTPNTTADA